MEGINLKAVPNLILRYYLSLINDGVNTRTESSIDSTQFEIPFSVDAEMVVLADGDVFDSDGKHIFEKGDRMLSGGICRCWNEKEKTLIENHVQDNCDEHGLDETEAEGWIITNGLFSYYRDGIKKGVQSVHEEFGASYSFDGGNSKSVCYRLFANVFFEDHSSIKLTQYFEDASGLNLESFGISQLGFKVGVFMESWRIILINPLDFLEFFEKKLLIERTSTTNEEKEVIIDEDTNRGIAHQVRYLHETGVLTYLKNAYEVELSANKVAFIVSKMLGCEITAVQRIILASLEENFLDHNHPEHSSKKYDTVRENLKTCGDRK